MTVEPELISRAQGGDDEAFARIVATYRPRVFGTIFRLAGPGQELEDVGQEVFLRLYQSLSQLREIEFFETWLYRLTVNTAYDYLRRKRRAADVPMCDLSDEQVVMADAAESARRSDVDSRQKTAREHLTVLLGQIPAEDRELLELKEIEGLSLKELRRRYDANESALKVRLFRARKRALEVHRRLFVSPAPAAPLAA